MASPLEPPALVDDHPEPAVAAPPDWGPVFPSHPPAGLAAALEEGREGIFGFGTPKPWQHSEHQVGFIGAGSGAQLPIQSGGATPADPALPGTRVDVRLDRLRIAAYPGGGQEHEVLVTFRARNVVGGVEEPLAFSQAFNVQEGQSAGVRGYPIFLGLSVGGAGLALQFATVNVSNSGDSALLRALRSDTVASGLGLLTSAQPAMKPLAGLAMGIGEALLRATRT